MKPNFNKPLLTVLALSAFGIAYAEDIDIYLANSSTSALRPNILIVLDNAAANNSSITQLDGTSGDKLEMLRQVLNNVIDPFNSPFFPACTLTGTGDQQTRSPSGCITRAEVSELIGGVNIGLMIANPSGAGKGGYVRSHIRSMEDNDGVKDGVTINRTKLISKINPAIPQANNAPYAKKMHETYLYFGGKTHYVGFDSTQFDAEARRTGTNNYAGPIMDSCSPNYVIFVANGGPDSGEDKDAQALLTSIGGRKTTDPVKFKPDNYTSNWFDEYARTLAKQDVAPNVEGAQHVNTYTIAVQNPADNSYNTKVSQSARQLLKSAAILGEGEYYEAHNGQQAMQAFIDILRKMKPTNSAFAAVTLPVSVNVRGTYLNQVYMGQFRPNANSKPGWHGNMKAYQIVLDDLGNPVLGDRFGKPIEDKQKGFILSDRTSFWTTASNFWSFAPSGTPESSSDAPDGPIVEKGGAAQKMRTAFATDQSGRKLYTCTDSCATTKGTSLSQTVFATTNTTGIPASSLGPTGTISEGERTAIINWVRGQDNRADENLNDSTTDVRASFHGDVLHSRPAVVNYNRTPGDRDVVIYYGANDGVFRAVKGGLDDADGNELWGVVFPEFFGRLKRLRDNGPNISSTAPKPYFADGPVSVYQKDENNDGKIVATDGDKAYLYVAMRRGGRFMYALDVSNPSDPKRLWNINSSGDFAELGQTWSSPRPAKVRALPNDPVIIFGAGYDAENEDVEPAAINNKGRGIFVVNARTGDIVKHVMHADMGSMPADITLINRDGDEHNYVDRIYAADTKGNIWRIDIDDADKSKWAVHKIATLGGAGEHARKFLVKPDVVTGYEFDAILIGSGDREHPFETTVANRFYMIKDPNIGLRGASLGITENDLQDVTTNEYQNKPLPADKKGWILKLRTGEKVVGNPITVKGTTYFPTNTLTPPAPGVCDANLGEARLYSVGFKTGNATQDLNGDGMLDSTDRSEKIAGGGFLPAPTATQVTINGKTYDVVCSGPHCTQPPGPPSNTRRYRTYWHKKND